METITDAAPCNGTNGTVTKKGEQDHRVFIMPIKWTNVFLLVSIHLLAIYSLYYMLFVQYALVYTTLFNVVWGYWGGFGVTGGAHRLWTHRAYKAKTPLKIILALGHACAGMNPIFDWVRDHRVHHKFSDTDADPHNANRGLFFSHCGWLLQKKHPEVLRRGKEVDMSDIISDPVVAFQEKYFSILMPGLGLILPTVIPPVFWGETWTMAFLFTVLRWVIFLNLVWSVNSFAHSYGYRPYNKKIFPAQNLLVSMFGLGEGWHNYHHTFPWDYKTAEVPYYFNLSTMLIDSFASIGWAYDLKKASNNLIQQCMNKSGDGTHHYWGLVPEPVQEQEQDDDKKNT